MAKDNLGSFETKIAEFEIELKNIHDQQERVFRGIEQNNRQIAELSKLVYKNVEAISILKKVTYAIIGLIFSLIVTAFAFGLGKL